MSKESGTSIPFGLESINGAAQLECGVDFLQAIAVLYMEVFSN